jgi:hypothetical protein
MDGARPRNDRVAGSIYMEEYLHSRDHVCGIMRAEGCMQAIAFSGVAHVARVESRKNARGREVEHLTLEAIEIRLGE